MSAIASLKSSNNAEIKNTLPLTVTSGVSQSNNSSSTSSTNADVKLLTQEANEIKKEISEIKNETSELKNEKVESIIANSSCDGINMNITKNMGYEEASRIHIMSQHYYSNCIVGPHLKVLEKELMEKQAAHSRLKQNHNISSQAAPAA